MTNAQEPDEEFEGLLSEEERKQLTAKEMSESDKLWIERISGWSLGQSARLRRPETEKQRAFKRRINNAADKSFRTLEWKSTDPNPSETHGSRTFAVQVKAVDTKAQAAAGRSDSQPTETTPVIENPTGAPRPPRRPSQQ